MQDSFGFPRVRIVAAAAAVAALLGATGAAWAEKSPYAGEEAQRIASLTPQDVEDLLLGRGWGFAKSAELNGYPGPTHILELADELELTPAQRTDVEAVFAAMNEKARDLGAAFVAAEAALDDAFETGRIDEATLVALTAEAARIEADLRATHLSAHLKVTPVLSRHQIMTYNRLRGYADEGDHGGHGNH